MKRLIYIALASILLAPVAAKAQEIVSQETTTEQVAKLRLVASYNRSFNHGLSLSVEEEIRTCLGGTSPAAFTRSYTTLALDYEPIPYLNIALGYTFKLYGNKGWTDPAEYIRHRAFLNVTGQVKINRWKLSLRERLLMDCRTDSVNPNEKNAIDLTMRHRLQATYSMFSKPLKFHVGIEFANSLNAPTDYLNACSTTQYGQYITRIRPEIGMRWRIDKRNSLSLSYRFDYGYKRDLNIKRKSGNIELTNAYKYNHLIILSYQFSH